MVLTVFELSTTTTTTASFQMESIYLDMQTQRLRVSPRAIEQGWVEEMEAKLKLQRAAITKLKLEAVFELGLELKQKEELLLAFQRRIRDLEESRRNVRGEVTRSLCWSFCSHYVLTSSLSTAQFEISREEEFLSYWEVRYAVTWANWCRSGPQLT